MEKIRGAVIIVILIVCAFPACALSGSLVIADTLLLADRSVELPVDGDSGFSLEVCARLKEDRNKDVQQWNLTLLDEEQDTVGVIGLTSELTLAGDPDSGRRIIAWIVDESGLVPGQRIVSENLSHTDGFFTIYVSVTDGLLEAWAGNESYLSIGNFPAGDGIASVTLETDSPLQIQSVNLKTMGHEPWKVVCKPPIVELGNSAGMIAPGDVYVYLDYETETRRALRGGDYQLGIVASGAGGFDLIYLSGAEYNADGWISGMVKGHLSPTMFVNHYDLTWTDAGFRTDISGAWGEFLQDNALLVLHFPNEKAVLRFYRESQRR